MVWVVDGSHMSLRQVHMSHRWVTNKSHMGLTMGHGLGYRCIIVGSHIVTFGSQMYHRWITGWVIYWSQMSHKWVTYWLFFRIKHFLSCSPNIPVTRHNPATLRIRQMNVIFDQSGESNTVVSSTALLWRFTTWFFTHRDVLDTTISQQSLNYCIFTERLTIFTMKS